MEQTTTSNVTSPASESPIGRGTDEPEKKEKTRYVRHLPTPPRIINEVLEKSPMITTNRRVKKKNDVPQNILAVDREE